MHRPRARAAAPAPALFLISKRYAGRHEGCENQEVFAEEEEEGKRVFWCYQQGAEEVGKATKRSPAPVVSWWRRQEEEL